MIGRLGALSIGVLLAILLLLCVEGLLRLIGVADGVPRHDPFAGFGTHVPMFTRVERVGQPAVFRVSPARLDRGRNQPNAEDGREFLADPPPDLFRVFVIGGSSAAGVPYPSRYAFPHWLESRLRAELPDLRVEVVNAALSGYASRRLLPIVREISEYEPDLLVVYMGHNEWAERRYYGHLIDMDPRLFRAWEWLVDTRLYRVLSPLFRAGYGPLDEPEPVTLDAAQNAVQMFGVLRDRAAGKGYPSARDLAYRDLLYEFNLEQMADAVEAVGGRTMFLTLSQNFSDWAPGASDHRRDLTASDLKAWQAHYRAGTRSAGAEDCPAAIDHYTRALAIDAEFAELHFRLADCHRRAEEWESARKHYTLASDLDRVPHGAPTRFNEILRRVADQHDAILVDTAALLSSASGNRLVGFDLFLDSLHPNLRAHQVIATAVAAALRAKGVPLASELWHGSAYRDADLQDLYTRVPELIDRELEIRMFTCQLALRDDCARAAARSLIERNPQHDLANRTLSRVEPE